MSDCGCDKAKHDLEEYIHHELERTEYADITEHVAGCTDCSDELYIGVRLTEAVRRACNETAPEELRERIVTRLRIEIQHS